MNIQPYYYMQTDPRWAKWPYSLPGEDTDIAESGCGPTCAAMIIQTMTGKTFTPLDACKWSLSHGYKAMKQGTYYSYFKAQFAEFGIKAWQLNGASLIENPIRSIHTKAFQLLQDGYYLIACMGPGLWTKGGHYVVVWWKDGKVFINDPASKKEARIRGDFELFKSQVKFYFVIDAQEFNKEEEDVTKEEVQKMIDESRPKVYRSIEEVPDWARPVVGWALASGILTGDQNGSLYLTTDNLVNLQMLYNYNNLTSNS